MGEENEERGGSALEPCAAGPQGSVAAPGASGELLPSEQRAIAMGIDLTLLDSRMAMTPEERIRAHGSAARLAQALAEAMEAKRERDREAAPKAG